MKRSSWFQFLLSFSMAFMPLHPAFAAETKKLSPAYEKGLANLKEMIKTAGLTQPQDFKVFVEKLKPFVQPKVYIRLAAYGELHPNETSPTIEVQEVAGAKKLIRVFIKSVNGSESFDINLAAVQANPQQFQALSTPGLTHQGKAYSYYDIYYDGKMDLGKKDYILTLAEIRRLGEVNPGLASDYLVKYKALIQSLEAYYILNEGSDYAAQVVAPWWLEVAQASWSKDGETCIVAGHISKVVKGVCGGDGFSQGCAKGDIFCNPLAYGFSDKGPICVPRKPAEQVSITCNKVSDERYDFKNDKNRNNLVKDIVSGEKCKGMGLKNCEADAYVKELTEHIRSAFVACSPIKGFESTDGVSAVAAFDRFREAKRTVPPPQISPSDIQRTWVDEKSKTSKKGKTDSDEHHRNACATLMNRLFDLERAGQVAACPISGATGCPTVVAPVQVVEAPLKPLTPTEVKSVPPVTRVEVPVTTPTKDEKSILPWLIGGAVLLCVFYFCKGSKSTQMPVGKPAEPEGTRIGGSGTTGSRPPMATPVAQPGVK